MSHHATNNKIDIRKNNNKLKNNKLKLIYVSQYSYHKNHINLLHAINEINKNKIRVTLDCYGQDFDDNFARIKNIVRLNNISGIKILQCPLRAITKLNKILPDH